MNNLRNAELVLAAETNVYIHHRENTKSGVYHYYFRHRGRQCRGSLSTADKIKAREAAVDRYIAVRNGLVSAKPKVPFGQIAHRWLKLNEHHRDLTNRRQAAAKMVEFFDNIAKVKDLGDLNQSHINDYLAWRKNYHTAAQRPACREYVRQGKRVVAKAQHYGVASNDTLNRENQSLRMILKFAAAEGWNVGGLSVQTLPSTKRRRPHFSAEEEGVLWKAARARIEATANSKIRAQREMLLEYMLVLRHTGLRPCELAGVRWADIDFNTQTLSIRKRHKTAPRVIGLDFGDLPTLMSNMREQRQQAAIGGAREFHPNSKLFPTKGEGGRSFKKSLESLIDECAFDEVDGKRHSAYSFRHTFATRRADEGMPSTMLAQHMGTSVKMLAAFYDHSSVQSVRNWMKAQGAQGG